MIESKKYPIIPEIKTSTLNGMIFKSVKLHIKGRNYILTEKTGDGRNYVNVCCTSTPWKNIGKDFNGWFEASQAYKSVEMKSALLNVSTLLLN